MKSTVSLRLLGTVEVEREGEPVVGFRSRKALALLGYLAVQEQPVPRERLAELLWAGRPERRGRANLTWVLGRIAKELSGCVRAGRHAVQLERGDSYWLDVDAFEELREQGDVASLAAAVALYRGEFLEGLALEGCAEFELWVVGEQERWRRRMVNVLRALMAHHGRSGEYGEGLGYGRRLLELEPWHEEAHRQVMRLLGWSGRRGAALAQYETCCRVLEEDLGVGLAEETVRLYEQVRDGKLTVPVAAAVRLPDFGAAPGAFPVEAGAEPVFVAREEELGRLEGVLGGAEGRGAGGVRDGRGGAGKDGADSGVCAAGAGDVRRPGGGVGTRERAHMDRGPVPAVPGGAGIVGRGRGGAMEGRGDGAGAGAPVVGDAAADGAGAGGGGARPDRHLCGGECADGAGGGAGDDDAGEGRVAGAAGGVDGAPGGGAGSAQLTAERPVRAVHAGDERVGGGEAAGGGVGRLAVGGRGIGKPAVPPGEADRGQPHPGGGSLSAGGGGDGVPGSLPAREGDGGGARVASSRVCGGRVEAAIWRDRD